jgi:hypothetical protein
MRPSVLGAACGLAISASIAIGQCQNPIWSPEFGAPGTGLDQNGFALLVFDPDGTGPEPEELYVGGGFNSAGGVPGTRGIARWNGVRWASVGGGLSGTTGFARQLASFDPDGPGPEPRRLVAGGWGVALWNGGQWATLGTLPANYYVTGLVEYDADGMGPELPRLIVCGYPTSGPEDPKVHAWNGTAWQALPEPVTAPEFANARELGVFDEDGAGPAGASLFIALNGGGGIRKLVGGAWEVVGGGLVRSGMYLCNSLAVVDLDGPGPGRSVLLVGGDFTTAGAITSPGVAAWTGSEWLPMALSSWITVEAFAVADYTQGSGAPTLYAYAFGALAEWDGAEQTWTFRGSDPSYVPLPGADYGLAAYRGSGDLMPSLYLTGFYTDVSGVASNHFARLACQNCYLNCDLSAGQPPHTANDFVCFIIRFAASDPYANCDGSTGTPMLTANDFACFLSSFVTGCS